VTIEPAADHLTVISVPAPPHSGGAGGVEIARWVND
jgi:hypothetical protein